MMGYFSLPSDRMVGHARPRPRLLLLVSLNQVNLRGNGTSLGGCISSGETTLSGWGQGEREQVEGL